MNTKSCECEHVAHTEKSKRTPNGNPGHKYGVKFNAALMKNIKTDYGTFCVCPDCAGDCMAPVRKNPAGRRERTRKRQHGIDVTNVNDFADPGAARIAALKKIVKEKQYAKLDGMMVDGFTASAIVQVYDAINEANKEKYRKLPVHRMATIAWKMLNKNPAPRIGTRKSGRRSQITGRAPSRRLVARRRRNSRKGFFPNPSQARRAQTQFFRDPFNGKLNKKVRVPREKSIKLSMREAGPDGRYIVQIESGGKWHFVGSFLSKAVALHYARALAKEKRQRVKVMDRN